MRNEIHELDDAGLDQVNGGSFISSVKEAAATVAGAVKAVGEAAACQWDAFACGPA